MGSQKTQQFQEMAQRWQEKLVVAARNWRPLLAELRNMALTGTVVAIPLIATVWLAQIAYHFITNISAGFLDTLGVNWPLVPFFVSLGLLIALGFMATNVLGQRVLDGIENTLLKIPVITTIYAGVKQVIDSFKSFNNMGNFKRVVYIDYPADGARLIGFVTGQYYDSNLGEEMTSVVIPTAPNPMTGLIIVVPNSKLTDSSLTLEEAMKMVVSAGLVAPKRRSFPQEDPVVVPVPLAVEVNGAPPAEA